MIFTKIFRRCKGQTRRVNIDITHQNKEALVFTKMRRSTRIAEINMIRLFSRQNNLHNIGKPFVAPVAETGWDSSLDCHI